VSQYYFEYNADHHVTVDGCKSYATNVMNKAGAEDFRFGEEGVWSTVTRHNHQYLVNVWCLPKDNVIFLTVAGAVYEDSGAIRDQLVDLWSGKKTESAAPPPVATESPACFASSDDGVVNVRETPNGVLIGPIPSGTPLTVLGTYPTNRQWSRIQTPWLARAGRVGVVATNLIQCN
jgi:hypothetical protein